MLLTCGDVNAPTGPLDFALLTSPEKDISYLLIPKPSLLYQRGDINSTTSLAVIFERLVSFRRVSMRSDLVMGASVGISVEFG